MKKRLEKKAEEVVQSPCTSMSIHSGSKEEVEEVPTDKKRRDKEKVLKRKNDAIKKKRKIDADKAKAEAKVAAEREIKQKEQAIRETTTRVATKQAKKTTKEVANKAAEAEDRRGETHSMETEILETLAVGKDTNIAGNGLGMELWTPFQPSEVLDLRIFTYNSKTGRFV